MSLAAGDDENVIEEPDMSHFGKKEDSTQLETFQIRPSFDAKFNSQQVKYLIHEVLQEELEDRTYDSEEAEALSKHIAYKIRTRIKDIGLPRYKLMVQVVLGEQHGAGVKTASRCLWDAECDSYANDVFLNVSFYLWNIF
uniref:Tctex1 domain-containing protein 2 n=1 Tax=Clastoptera arizonana TaxID=38151 RepID=A0A1B6E1Y3_9HEMI